MVKHKDTGEYLHYIYWYVMRKQYPMHEAYESDNMKRL